MTQLNPADESFLARLAADLPDTVLSEAEPRYLSEPRGLYHGQAGALARPRNTEEVATLVRHAAAARVPVVPYGGGTGLVGGQVAWDGPAPLVISLERMTATRGLDPLAGTLTVEAGAILADVQTAAEDAGKLFPLSLASEGSARIGGLLSTNAGGVNVLRYGMTRELVLGLEVVLPDGSILNGLSTLRKDNRGIDLKQLFIGAEGTLGIITAVSVKLTPYPDQVATALLGLASLEDAITLYRRARRDCCDLMSAFEFMPPLALTLAREAIPDLPLPMSGDYPAYVLMEISGCGLVDIQDLMERFLEGVMEDGLVLDGTLASSQAQAKNLWLIREGMNEGQAKRGAHMRSDVSVPLSKLPAFVHDAEQAIHAALPDCICVSYGHVGDGNVHLNCLPPSDLSAAEKAERIYRSKTVLNEVVDQYAGSISAEHGIGRLKQMDFDTRLPEVKRRLLTAIKRAIDPDLVMNPGCQLNLSAES